ncbi:CIC11C00000002220 [Sungouiella intermedia]|uniref:D-serine dehydratase n=1 Tax=Sungouiella intermedia TaxID=45354 RepID=A0A1L0BK47_9ASCO|nr:CIC11C00000002220 [[Candida] intermedia]
MFPSEFIPVPDKNALLATYKGKKVEDLPTPSLIIDKTIFAENCEKMLANAAALDADFRAHIKTHKTVEGSELQLGSNLLKTDKIVVSTLAEAWGILGLVEKKIVNDIHFSLPVVKSRLSELAALAEKVPYLRLMLDDSQQLDILAQHSKTNNLQKKWSVFVKIDIGTKRAGLVNDSHSLKETIAKFSHKNIAPYVSLYGFYCHAGHSYSADSVASAKQIFLDEISHANKASQYAISVDPSLAGNLVISVGATPTAHSSSVTTIQEINDTVGKLAGKLELHAGCYPCCDLQQVSTGLVSLENVSVSVLAEVVSTYPGRGDKGPGEQLVNAGVLALAREFSAFPGHGRVVSPVGYENWIVGRLSQEHGILVPFEEKPTEFLPLGTMVRIVPQHACIAAAQFPFQFVIENGAVVDVWVSYKYW